MIPMAISRATRRHRLKTALALTAALWGGYASAAPQEARQVYIPVLFDAESTRIPTSACIAGIERSYAQPQWWIAANVAADAPESALRAVIAAMKSRDREALLRLSDPASTADRERFERQAAAYFSQMQTVQIESVPLAYDLGGLVQFYLRFQLQGKAPFAPLAFARMAKGTVGFLPVRADQVALRLLDNWFTSQWGPSSGTRPTYCTDDKVKRATHRVALGPAQGAAVAERRGAILLLTGGSFDAPGPVAEAAKQAKSAIAEIQAYAKDANVKGIADRMTAQGAASLQQWYGTAAIADRERYFASLRGLKPLFLFDASPLIVVYVHTGEGIQVLYFTAGAKPGELHWTNSSFLSIVDEIFKKGPLFSAATAERLFQDLAIGNK